MDQINFVGCVLSLDCGDSLGTFQGEVTEVNKGQQSISLRNPFRNGVKFDIPEITIRAVDIRDLKILKSLEQVQDGKGQDSQGLPLQNGNGSVQNATANGKHRQPSNGTQKTPKKNERQTGGGNRRTPTKTRGDQSSQNGTENGRTAIYSGTQHSAFQRVQKEEGKEQDITETEDKDRKPKHFSGNIDTNQRVRSSPRKIEGGGRQKRVSAANAKNEECFSAPVESFLTKDFDFDKSRESFNKAAIFEEITMTLGCGGGKKKVKNIPHNEDILLDNVPAFIHDKGGGQVKCTSYMAETGVAVPAVTVETIQRVYQEADKLGLTAEKRLEAAGVCMTGMVQDLIDGTIRDTRDKEQPRVTLVCGPHVQGAQGITLARHLANRNLSVTLFLPNFAKMPEMLMAELRAFKKTEGRHVTNVQDLPEESPDLIISALDTPSDTLIAKQPWHKSIVGWVADCKSSVLALDPTPTHGIRSKWSIITGLPLSYDNTNPGILYLCDVGIPAKLFSSAGIQYTSPYKKKFMVRLHNH